MYILEYIFELMDLLHMHDYKELKQHKNELHYLHNSQVNKELHKVLLMDLQKYLEM